MWLKKSSKNKGIRVTRQGIDPIHGVFRKRTDPNLRDYYWMSAKVPLKKNDNRVDTYALNRDYVTVTPIQSDLTDYTYLDDLHTWKL